jgi:hypothetical protein
MGSEIVTNAQAESHSEKTVAWREKSQHYISKDFFPESLSVASRGGHFPTIMPLGSRPTKQLKT